MVGVVMYIYGELQLISYPQTPGNGVLRYLIVDPTRMFLTSIKSDYSKIGMLTPAFVKKGIRVFHIACPLGSDQGK